MKLLLLKDSCRMPKRSIGGETGFVIPFIAIISIGVLAVVFTLGFGTSRTRQAAKTIQAKAEEICQATLANAYLQRQAATVFKQQVDVASIPHVTLTGATLMIPTMPESGCFGFDHLGDCSSVTDKPFFEDEVLFGEIRDGSGDPIIGSCNLPCPSGPKCPDCLFVGTTSKNYATANFPPDFWKRLGSVGQTVSCELRGTINTIMGGISEIVGKTAYHVPVRGEFAPDPTDSITTIGTFPALTIALAPELTTQAKDPRFRFPFAPNVNDPGTSDLRYDPLEALLPTLGDSDKFFSSEPQDRTIAAFGDDLIAHKRKPSDIYQAGGISGVQADADTPGAKLPITETNYDPTKTDYIISDRSELAAACMNPVVLVRNNLVSTFMELASRHGQLRKMTRLLFVNPQHRDPSTKDSFPDVPNAPVISVNFGEDLTSPTFTAPFVSYYSGDADYAASKVFGERKGGLIAPFETGHDPAMDDYPAIEIPKLLRHQALIAGQLRSCFHMYNSDGLKRYDIPGLKNVGFEPDGGGKAYEFRTELTMPLSSTTDDWEAKCDWDGCPKSQGLTAAELAATVGSVQECPYYSPLRYDSDSDGKPDKSTVCPKPALDSYSGGANPPITNDLRPDLVGLLSFISESNGIPGEKMPAFASPGLFPVRTDYDATKEDHRLKPFSSSDAYSEAVNVTSPLLLITHQALSSGEKSLIKNIVESIPQIPITVVYIPAELPGTTIDHWKDAQAAYISDFETAFKVGKHGFNNSLFVLAPNLDDCATATQPQCFLDYWQKLLNDPTRNISIIAKSIFAEKILSSSLKL